MYIYIYIYIYTHTHIRTYHIHRKEVNSYWSISWIPTIDVCCACKCVCACLYIIRINTHTHTHTYDLYKHSLYEYTLIHGLSKHTNSCIHTYMHTHIKGSLTERRNSCDVASNRLSFALILFVCMYVCM